MDEKVCDAQKKLDLEKYKTSKKMAQLEELQTQYNQMQKDASDAVATDAGESEEAEVGWLPEYIGGIQLYFFPIEYSKDRLIRPLIILTVCLIWTISLDTFHWLPMLKSTLNSDDHLIWIKITAYFSSELSSLYCILPQGWIEEG